MTDNAWIRNGVFVGGLVAIGVIAVLTLPMFTSVRGVGGPLIAVAQSPVAAVVGLVMLLACATAVAIVVSRITNTCVGLWVMGGGLFVLGYRFGTLDETVWELPAIAIGIEAIILAALGMAAVLAVFRFGGELDDIEPDEHHNTPDWLRSTSAWKQAACGLIVLPAVWFIGQSPAQGQMLAAVLIGGTLAGLVGRLVSPHVQPKLLFISPVIACGIAAIVAAIMLGDPIEEAFISGTLPGFLRTMPIDVLAGSLMGVSMGFGWARAFLHHEEVETASG